MNGFWIKNGTVFEAAEGKFCRHDVFVRDGVFLDYPDGHEPYEVIDAEGKYVLPGLIDAHLHIDLNGSLTGANADTVCIPSGVTTACDGGTCGASGFPQFYNSNIIRYETHTYSFLNVSTFGNKSFCIHQEDHDPEDFRADLIEKMFLKYPGVIRALKVRMCRATLGTFGMRPLYRALEISGDMIKKGIRCPVVVHYDDLPENVSVGELFGALRPGDIVAHVYQTKGETIFQSNGTIHPAVLDAQKRGVIMDACHGRVHWSFPNLKNAARQDFLPDIISSDIVRASEYAAPGFSLPYAMSVESAAGVPVEKILQCVTINPARALGIGRLSGSIAAGRAADITVMDIIDTNRQFTDAYGNTASGNKLFVPLLTMIEGRVAYRSVTL